MPYVCSIIRTTAAPTVVSGVHVTTSGLSRSATVVESRSRPAAIVNHDIALGNDAENPGRPLTTRTPTLGCQAYRQLTHRSLGPDGDQVVRDERPHSIGRAQVPPHGQERPVAVSYSSSPSCADGAVSHHPLQEDLRAAIGLVESPHRSAARSTSRSSTVIIQRTCRRRRRLAGTAFERNSLKAE